MKRDSPSDKHESAIIALSGNYRRKETPAVGRGLFARWYCDQ
jgi:hypothetical protein